MESYNNRCLFLCLLTYFYLFLSETTFLLLEMEISDGLEAKCKMKSPFSKCMYHLTVTTVLSVTAGPEARRAGYSCAHKKKTRKMQKSEKTNHKLESTAHNPRSERGVASLWCRKLSKGGVF